MTPMTTTRPRSRNLPDFIGAWPRLTGRQEPEFESRHPGDEDEGDRCAKFGFNLAKYGASLRCMPWEWSTLRGILSLQPPNEYGERLWTHRDSAIECTRQQGKTLLITLLILFLLFVEPALGRARVKHIVYTAQVWRTASQVFDRVESVITRVPYMRKQLKKPPSKRDNHGVIELKNGGMVEFGPRSQHFARGYTMVDVVILDEAYDVNPAHEANLTGTQSASPNPMTIYISTAPVKDEHPDCKVLADLHRQGHRHSPDLFYQLFAAPRHMKRDNPDAWALAQPSYGVGTNEREISSKCEKASRNARRRALFDADYLGWGDYPPPEVEGNSEIPTEKWAEMRAKEIPTLVGRPAVVIERQGSGPWVITAAWRTTTGPVLIEVGYTDHASDDTVVSNVVALRDAWDPVAVLVRHGSAAAELQAKLETAGVEVTVVNRTEVSQACGGFLNAATSAGLTHSGQSQLDDAVSAAIKHKLPAGGFIWELVDEVTYPALMGSSVAHYGLIKHGAPPKRKPVAPRTAAKSTTPRRKSSEFDAMSAAF